MLQLGAAEIVAGLIYMGITTMVSIIALSRGIFGTDRDRLVEYLQQRLKDAETKIQGLVEESATQRAEIAALQRLPFSQLSELGQQLAAGSVAEHKQILDKLDFITDMHAGAVELGRRMGKGE